MPQLASRAQQLNAVAGEIILDGMLSYGWTKKSLFETNTRLRDVLLRHCPALCNTPTSGFPAEHGSLDSGCGVVDSICTDMSTDPAMISHNANLSHGEPFPCYGAGLIEAGIPRTIYTQPVGSSDAMDFLSTSSFCPVGDNPSLNQETPLFPVYF